MFNPLTKRAAALFGCILLTSNTTFAAFPNGPAVTASATGVQPGEVVTCDAVLGGDPEFAMMQELAGSNNQGSIKFLGISQGQRASIIGSDLVGPVAEGRLGFSATSLPVDFFGHGVRTAIFVGAPAKVTSSGSIPMKSYVIDCSNPNFNISLTASPSLPNDALFGYAVASIVNPNTGQLLLFVGAPGAVGTGQVYGYRANPVGGAYSIVDSSPFITLSGGFTSFFGSTLHAADVNGDGVKDLAVGARFESGLGMQSGEVKVFSGAQLFQGQSQGQIAITLSAPEDSAGLFQGFVQPGQIFGKTIASADVDGDGRFELGIGAPQWCDTDWIAGNFVCSVGKITFWRYLQGASWGTSSFGGGGTFPSGAQKPIHEEIGYGADHLWSWSMAGVGDVHDPINGSSAFQVGGPGKHNGMDNAGATFAIWANSIGAGNATPFSLIDWRNAKSANLRMGDTVSALGYINVGGILQPLTSTAVPRPGGTQPGYIKAHVVPKPQNLLISTGPGNIIANTNKMGCADPTSSVVTIPNFGLDPLIEPKVGNPVIFKGSGFEPNALVSFALGVDMINPPYDYSYNPPPNANGFSCFLWINPVQGLPPGVQGKIWRHRQADAQGNITFQPSVADGWATWPAPMANQVVYLQAFAEPCVPATGGGCQPPPSSPPMTHSSHQMIVSVSP